MTSQDNSQYITVEMFNERTSRLEAQVINLGERQDNSFRELKNEIQEVKNSTLVNGAKIDAYRDFTGIWFTVIAVIVAIIGVATTLAPMFRDIYRDSKQSRNQENLREMIREEVNIAVNRALNTK